MQAVRTGGRHRKENGECYENARETLKRKSTTDFDMTYRDGRRGIAGVGREDGMFRRYTLQRESSATSMWISMLAVDTVTYYLSKAHIEAGYCLVT